MKSTEPIPFHSPEAESGAIGAMLVDQNVFDAIDSALPAKQHAFYDNRLRCLYEVIAKMREQRMHIDLITLSDQLTKVGRMQEAGGIEFIAKLPDCVPSADTGVYYAQIVNEKHIHREMMRSVVKLKNCLSNAGEQAMEAMVDQFERAALDIRNLLTKPSHDVDNKEALRELIDVYNNASSGKRPYYVPTGYPDLDRISGGMRPGELIVIGAYTSKGKSTLALNIAENCAAKGFPVGIFSLEMPGIELLARMVASISRVNSRAAEEGVLNEKQLYSMVSAVGRAGRLPIHIHDRSGIPIEYIANHSANWVKKNGVKLIVIDHLQLVAQRDSDVVASITEIADKSKVMAMNLKVPVILISQLNRSSEKEARIPALHDLRQSGGIEQAANYVWLLFNDDKEKDVVRLFQAKARRGPLEHVSFYFNKQINRFESIERKIE